MALLSLWAALLNPLAVWAEGGQALPEYEFKRLEGASVSIARQLLDSELGREGSSFWSEVYGDHLPRLKGVGAQYKLKLFDSLNRRLTGEMTLGSRPKMRFSDNYLVIFGDDAVHFFDRELNNVKNIAYPIMSSYSEPPVPGAVPTVSAVSTWKPAETNGAGPSESLPLSTSPPFKRWGMGDQANPNNVAMSTSGRHLYFMGGWIWDDALEQWRFDGTASYFFQGPVLAVSDRYMAFAGATSMHCVYVRALDAPPVKEVREFEHDEVCPTHGFFGLGADKLQFLKFVDDTHLLVVHGDTHRSCLFDLKTLQKLDCFSESFLALDGQINRGLFYNEDGQWLVYQLNPKKLIGQGMLMGPQELANNPDIGRDAYYYQNEVWLMGPLPGLIDDDQRLVSYVDRVMGRLSIIDLKNGRQAGEQFFDVKRNEVEQYNEVGFDFWGISMTQYEKGVEPVDYELVRKP